MQGLEVGMRLLRSRLGRALVGSVVGRWVIRLVIAALGRRYVRGKATEVLGEDFIKSDAGKKVRRKLRRSAPNKWYEKRFLKKVVALVARLVRF
jgi:hypothetical protein